MNVHRLQLYLALVACFASACSEDPTVQRGFAEREFPAFDNTVYPVLLRDCGFPDCHGAPQRFFRVYGPGRSRLPREMVFPAALDQPTGDEVATSYALAQSMIDAADPARSLLLRKPLAVEAGGAGHLGVDKYGRDVYRTTQDAGYLAIQAWVMSPPPMRAAPGQ